MQPKHQNGGAISANIEGLRPCLSKPSYGLPQWALVVRLMQKGRLKSPHKPLFDVTGLFFGSNFVGNFWLAISEPGWVSRKKVPLAVLLKLTWRIHTRRWSWQIQHFAGIKFEWWGCGQRFPYAFPFRAFDKAICHMRRTPSTPMPLLIRRRGVRRAHVAAAPLAAPASPSSGARAQSEHPNKMTHGARAFPTSNPAAAPPPPPPPPPVTTRRAVTVRTPNCSLLISEALRRALRRSHPRPLAPYFGSIAPRTSVSIVSRGTAPPSSSARWKRRVSNRASPSLPRSAARSARMRSWPTCASHA